MVCTLKPPLHPRRKNGNLTDDGEKYKYVYNPFGQLVKITDRSSVLVAEYHYNGLGQRISEQTDTNRSGNTGIPDGTVDGNDPVFYIAVDQQGRRVATYRGTDTYPKETFVYHPDIARGPNFQGGVLLRDRYSGLGTTPSTWATAAGNATRDERHYYASDYRGNVVALLKSDGTLAEQYRYSSSGVPFGLPAGSVKGDGVVDGGTSGADYLIVDNIITNTHVYEQRADLNLDGVVDSGDLALVAASNGRVAGRGSISTIQVRNRHGYNAEPLRVATVVLAVIDTQEAGLDTNEVISKIGGLTGLECGAGCKSNGEVPSYPQLPPCLSSCMKDFGSGMSGCWTTYQSALATCRTLECRIQKFQAYTTCITPIESTLSACRTACWTNSNRPDPEVPAVRPDIPVGAGNCYSGLVQPCASVTGSKAGCFDCCISDYLARTNCISKTIADEIRISCGERPQPSRSNPGAVSAWEVCAMGISISHQEDFHTAASDLMTCRRNCNEKSWSQSRSKNDAW